MKKGKNIFKWTILGLLDLVITSERGRKKGFTITSIIIGAYGVLVSLFFVLNMVV